MKPKIILCVALVLSGGLFAITSTTSTAQGLPGFNFGIREPSVTNLFSRPFTATADLEMRNGDAATTIAMGLCADDGKVRTYFDLANVQGSFFDAKALAVMKQIGQDRWVSIDRPDENKTIEIYPGRRAYIEKPLDENPFHDSTDAEPEPVKTLLGHETIEGHPCDKYSLTFGTNLDISATVWEAADLEAFPIRIEFGKDDIHMKIQYHNIKLGEQDTNLFEVPKGYTQYDNEDDMLDGRTSQSKISESKDAVDARVLKSQQELADQGDRYGEYRMGLRYRDGDGVPKDLVKARELLQKSAGQGYPDAAAELAKISTKPKLKPAPSETSAAKTLDLTNLTILSAEFGMGKQVTNVTARVIELLHTQPDGFTADAKSLGADPLPGKKKRLVVNYDYKGDAFTLTIPAAKQMSYQSLVKNASK
jgi:hypothetical protein